MKHLRSPVSKSGSHVLHTLGVSLLPDWINGLSGFPSFSFLFFSFLFPSLSLFCTSFLLPFPFVPLSLSFLSLFLSFLSSLPFLLRISRTAVPFLSSPYFDLISFTLFLSFFCSFCSPCSPPLPRYAFLCCEIISYTSLPPC